jgi:hypothetical protein
MMSGGPMSKFIIFILTVMVSSLSNLYSTVNYETEIEDIIARNIEAAGGSERISQINTYFFKAGRRHYYMSSSGIMKMTSGSDPVITEIILTTPETVIRNCYNLVGSLKPLLASTYQSFAKLRCGFFTLMNFSGQLEYKGESKLTNKNYIVLSSKEGVLDVEILIDTSDYLIKGFNLSGYGPAEGRYQINCEIRDYQEVDGIMLPTSWFISQLGTRGILHEITTISFDPDLPSDFFSSLELNAGKVEINSGILKGNVMTVELIRDTNLMISTNWTKDHIQKAGFKTGDNLQLEINEERLIIDLFESLPPRNAYKPGSIIMIPSRSDENYIIYLLSSDFKHLAEILTPLYPIQILKIE